MRAASRLQWSLGGNEALIRRASKAIRRRDGSIMRTLWIALGAAALLGCATGHDAMRGSVVMKTSDTEAHVCLGNGEVVAGDAVDLVRHKCKPVQKGIPPTELCSREVAATGTIVETLNEHYSVARFPAGTEFKEGDSVEKHAAK
jgi:hypothetical protein